MGEQFHISSSDNPTNRSTEANSNNRVYGSVTNYKMEMFVGEIVLKLCQLSIVDLLFSWHAYSIYKMH